MASSNFIDHVKINFKSGSGGAGAMHFFRAKGVPNGGPDGGDGGNGGSIILRGNTQLWTLLHLRYTKHVVAESGKNGSESNCTGASGKDIYVDVPLGTIARHAETGQLMAEITEEGQQVVLLLGGKGGLGNINFKNSVMQAPRHSQPGRPGLEEWIVMELKVLADVGLVGLPNAGKSTLLAALSAARPAIANYPFTTLTPNLGVVAYRDFQSFVMADIPGIIEGASEGKGLGLRFLRHIERNSVLLFMIACTSPDIKAEYKTLLSELKKYNPELLDKKRILAISQNDLADPQTPVLKSTKDLPVIYISAATGNGLTKLKDLIWKQLH